MQLNRSRTSLTAIACLVSIGAHVIGVGALAWYSQHESERIAIALAKWRPKPNPSVVTEVSEPPPPIPPMPEAEPVDIHAIDFGEAMGEGEAINSSRTDGIQRAPDPSQDQAALTRDPSGAESPQPKPAAPQATPPMEALASLSEVRAFRPPSHEMRLPESAVGRTAPKAPKPTQGTDERSHDEQPARAEQTITAPPQPERHPEPPADPSPTTPAQSTGSPLEHTDRDSDLAAAAFSLKYERGGVKASKGREFKFARPRDNLAAHVEAAALSFPLTMNLQVQIDEQGNVKRVIVLRSTGSKTIDHIFELATYRSWFEPPKDKSGKPTRDEFTYEIVLN